MNVSLFGPNNAPELDYILAREITTEEVECRYFDDSWKPYAFRRLFFVLFQLRFVKH